MKINVTKNYNKKIEDVKKDYHEINFIQIRNNK